MSDKIKVSTYEYNLSEIEELKKNSRKNFFKRFFRKAESGSMRIGILNLISISLGIGLLYGPSSCQQVGFLMFIFFLLISWLINKITLLNYLYLLKQSKKKNLFEIVNYYLGKKFQIITYFIFAIFLVCINIISFILSNKLLYKCLKDFNFKLLDYNIFKIIFAIVTSILLFPIIFIKKAENLKILSIFYIIFILIIILTVVFQSFYFHNYYKNDIIFKPIQNLNINYLTCFSILLFSFFCQFGIFDLWLDLKRPSKRRCKKLINFGLSYQIFIMFLISVSGYYGLGDKFMTENILDRKTIDSLGNDLFKKIVSLIFSVAILFKIPLLTVILINQTLNFFNLESNLKNRILIGYIQIIICGLFLVFYPNVTNLIDIVSSIFINYLGFILPIIIYIKNKKIGKFEYYYNIFIMFIMSFFGFFNITIKFIK